MGDPRLSLEERYGTRDNWLAGVRASANAMVTQRYLLRADADAMIAQAEASNIMKSLPAVPTATLVEFYWAAKDQYFYTSDAAEIAALDAGKVWVRTGQSFKVFVSGSSGGQGTAACRFYGIAGGVVDAHVFTLDAAECTSLNGNANWVRENASAFEAALPYSVTGACAKNTTPVYRINYKGSTRLTTSLAEKIATVAKGGTAAGSGPTGIGMCSPT